MSKPSTVSELAFEAFLKDLAVPFDRIETAVSPRPDYEVAFSGTKVTFEVKQIEVDSDFGPILKSRTVGNHVRSKISEAKKQLQWAASNGFPAILVIYNAIDRMHLFGTENHDFEAAMFGEHTVEIGFEPAGTSDPAIVESYRGRNKSLSRSKNSSFSALARLRPNAAGTILTIFENPFAKHALPYEKLPLCFDILRFKRPTEPGTGDS